MKTQIRELLNKKVSYREIERQLGCARSTIAYHARRLNTPIDERANKRYNWVEIREYYDAGNTYKKCKEKFGFSSKTWDKAVKAKKIIPRSLAILLNEQLIEKSKGARASIKRKLLQQKVLENKCAECDQSPEWLGKKLVMVLDHINGINDDYRLENLRLLCPNCNSQTETFSGKNIKKHAT